MREVPAPIDKENDIAAFVLMAYSITNSNLVPS